MKHPAVTMPRVRRRTNRQPALVFVLALVFTAAPTAGHAGSGLPAAPELPPGIAFRSETRHSPPQRLFIAEVDLGNKRLTLHAAPGGPDPDGDGPWETTLLQPTRIAAREGFALVVNGDFFRCRPAEGAATGYRAGLWANATGPAVSRGKAWSTTKEPTPCLVVLDDGSVRIRNLSNPGRGIREAIAGNTLLLKDGKPVPHANQARHPRTAVGLRDQGDKRLVLLVVDGRRAMVAAGMTYDELAAELLRLGCRQALNLDGGGSSLMAARDPATGSFRILNVPTDGRERPVANALGIVATPAR